MYGIITYFDKEKKEGCIQSEDGRLLNFKEDSFGPNLNVSFLDADVKVVFDADEAEQLGKEGKKVILVRPETTPDDIHGIVAAEAVVTSRGGMTSHAAVVARGMGKACICGCESLKIDLKNVVH